MTTKDEALRIALKAHKNLIRAYVNLLETGRDRIISHGGTCDSVEQMEASDPALREAREAITAIKQSSTTWHGNYPEPLREAPDVGAVVWHATPDQEWLAVESWWDGDHLDLRWLQRGRLHLTQEAAEKHARFEIELAGGVV